MLMRMLFSLTLMAMVAGALPSEVRADEKADPSDAETVDVKLKDLTLKLPKTWTRSDVVNNMRLATYDIPAAEGDREKGELTVSTFPGGGGEVSANLERWVGQFDADGRESVIKEGAVGDNTYYIAEISGTYKKSVGPPIAGKTEPKEGYRMLGVILNVKGKGVYFLKLTGPDETIKAQSEALRQSFGAKADDEKDYEI